MIQYLSIVALDLAIERIREEQLKFQRQAYEELGRVEAQVQRTRELLADAVGQRVRTEIRSPSDGIVKNIRYTTVGGVVSYVTDAMFDAVLLLPVASCAAEALTWAVTVGPVGVTGRL